MRRMDNCRCLFVLGVSANRVINRERELFFVLHFHDIPLDMLASLLRRAFVILLHYVVE